MTSLVTEVLLQAGKLDKEDLHTKVSKLSSLSFELKKKISDIIEMKYGQFSPMYTECDSILKELTEQRNAMKDIQGTLSGVVKLQLQDSTSEFEHLSEEHAKTCDLLNAMEQICQVVDLIDTFRLNKQDRNLTECAKVLLKIDSILERVRSSNLCDIDVFKLLRSSYLVHLEDIKYSLGEEWRAVVSWKLPSNEQNPTEALLKIPCFDKTLDQKGLHRDRVQDLMTASSMLNFLDRKIQEFSKVLMTQVLSPMVNEPLLEPVVKNMKDISDAVNGSVLEPGGGVATVTGVPPSLQISLVRNSSKRSSAHEESSSKPAHTFQKVVSLLHYINANFLCLKMNDGNTLMSLFSKYTRDDLLQLIINKCLAESIPKTKSQLDNYQEVADAVESFESALRDINFIPQHEKEGRPVSKLRSYAANVSFHFANRRCTDILQQARSIMHRDNHNTVELTDDEANLVDMPTYLCESKSQIMAMPVGTGFDSQKPSKLLSDNTLRLPKCCISQNAKDVMKVAYETLKEASESEPSTAMQLAYTAQNIFELFAAVVPIYHKESLVSLPQLSAIFHNDCMYIAHQLLTLGHQFSSISSGTSKGSKIISFVHQVPMIRRLGAECFLQQIKRQNDLILQCLEPIRTFSENVSADKYNNAERAMKQVLHLLNHLHKVWVEVLPANILRRSLCVLVNSCVGDLVKIVCAMEDISADDSVSLKVICLLLSDQVPNLFVKKGSEDNQMKDVPWQKQVPKWYRLQELILLLSANLREINDRWSEGKGPLAATFSITEVKSLIRALFQNTEHRAQALLKIRI